MRFLRNKTLQSAGSLVLYERRSVFSVFTSFYKRERPNDASLVKQKINWKVKNIYLTQAGGHCRKKATHHMFCSFFNVRNLMMRFVRQNKTLQSAALWK